MSLLFRDPDWNETQVQFMKNLEAAGATKAEHAVPIDRTMGLPARDLQALIDAGVVREAAANGYYLYPRQIRSRPPTRQERLADAVGDSAIVGMHVKPFDARRFIKVIVFWIIIILIPIVMIQMLGNNR